MDNETKWNNRFMTLAAMVASWSKDPGLKVGAVIVYDRRIVSVGYNGLPKEVPDKREWLDDRDIKLQLTVHAEANAILFAQRDLMGHSIYTWPLPPCAGCAALIIQSGISHVVSPAEYGDRWAASIALGKEMFDHAYVEVERI